MLYQDPFLHHNNQECQALPYNNISSNSSTLETCHNLIVCNNHNSNIIQDHLLVVEHLDPLLLYNNNNQEVYFKLPSNHLPSTLPSQANNNNNNHNTMEN
jgi:hypothetical protein